MDCEKTEIDHLRAFNTGMSLTIGMLRGMMIGLTPHLTPDQKDILHNIDKNIHLMFYNHQFKVKEDK